MLQSLSVSFELDPLDGVFEQLGGTIELQLAFDIVAMGIDGLYTQMQLIGSLAGL